MCTLNKCFPDTRTEDPVNKGVGDIAQEMITLDFPAIHKVELEQFIGSMLPLYSVRYAQVGLRLLGVSSGCRPIIRGKSIINKQLGPT